jgi:hypothetical protein
LDQQIVGALAHRDAPLKRIRLAAFVKGHHHHGRAVAADQLRLVQKLFLAFLERNGIDDALALQAFQAGFDDLPFRRVHHHRHLADVRFGRDEVEKARHRGDAVNHSLVHADVNDLRAVLDLLARDGQRGLVIAGLDELGELRRPGDVGALADVQEIDGGDRVQFPANSQIGRRGISVARRNAVRAPRIVSASSPLNADKVRTVGTFRGGKPRTASAMALMCAGVVPQQPPTMLSQPFCAHSRSCGASVSGVSGKAGREQGIGQAGVRIRADVNRREAGKFLDQRAQFLRPQRAVHADGEQGNVGNGIPERLDRLAGHAAVAARLDERDGGQNGNS